MSVTRHATFRLDDETRALLIRLADHYGQTKTGVLETLIRAAARKLPRRPREKARR